MNSLKEINYKKTKTEYSMTLVLLALLSFGMLALALMGQNLSSLVSREISRQDNIRTASEYVLDTIRKNDSSGKLFTFENNYGPGIALMVKESISETEQFRWIFYADGKLHEVINTEQNQPGYENSKVLCTLSSFALLYDEAGKTLNLEITDNNLNVYQETIVLRNSSGLSTGGEDD